MLPGRRPTQPGNLLQLVLLVVLFGAVPVDSAAQQLQEEPTHGAWGDQGDGTYANPILPGDFSDLDAIRVGSDYFAISSTMQYSPGMAVLHSRDLVNWTIAGHVVEDLTQLDPALNWDRMSRPGRGIWAGSLRYHDGRFWTYFGTPDQGIFMSTAAQAAGPWTQPKLVLAAPGWDDPCPFWDDDGQAYLVATHFAPEGPARTTYNIHLFQMTPSGERLLPDSDSILHRSKGSEANKLYKIGGLYYHLFSEVAPEGRVVMMERSRSLKGPWTIRQLIHVNAAADKEPNQGGLVELPSGKWYFVSHQGTCDWEGRAGVLLPVTWVDGWPILGRVGPDGIGNMVWRGAKLIAGFPETKLWASDEFASATLGPAWEWRYQPRAEMWSLTERPGFLRLHAFPPLRAGDFNDIGNVLTQRAFRTRHSEVTVKLDLAGRANGQEAGLAHFASASCTLAVVQENGIRHLRYRQADGPSLDGPAIEETTLFLRSEWGFDGIASFSYSLDGTAFRPMGSGFKLTWGNYRGDRIGLFTDNPGRAAGFVDFASFAYRKARE
jgi:beta-xylosidase